MYGVENRFKISFSLGLKGVPLYREIPATKNHLTHKHLVFYRHAVSWWPLPGLGWSLGHWFVASR